MALLYTRNSLPEEIREKSVMLLNRILVNTIDLALALKQAHWNIRGENFLSVHEWLDGFRNETDNWVDDIAERCVQLGGTTQGTVTEVAKHTKLSPFPAMVHDQKDILATLCTSVAQISKEVREGIDFFDEIGDKDSADLFTGFSRELDKRLWFIEAQLKV